MEARCGSCNLKPEVEYTSLKGIVHRVAPLAKQNLIKSKDTNISGLRQTAWFRSTGFSM